MIMWKKIHPSSIKLLQILLNTFYRNNEKMKLQLPTYSKTLQKRSLFAIVASYTFIWPMKTTKQLKNDKAVDQLKAVIDNADNLFENGHYEDSFDILSEYEDQDNVEIKWRLVRALYNMSKDTKYDKRSRKDFVYQAYDIIKELLSCHPDCNVVHKWYALILDTKSSYEGMKERIQQLENVKKHMDLAVTFNPEDATSLHMLGEWCFQITEMPWHQRKIAEVLFASPPQSSYEDALEYFLKAEAAEPRFYSMNLLRIGNCYLKLKKDDQAKYYLRLAASYPAKSNDDHRANKEATELLKKII